jgi:hypothetical protein
MAIMNYTQPIDRQMVVLELEGAVVFNFEESMEAVIRKCPKDNPTEDAIQFTTPKSRRANLRSVFEILFPDG